MLQDSKVESSIADILISLSGEENNPTEESIVSLQQVQTVEFTLDKIREQVASLLTDHQELVVDSSLLRKEKSQYSQSELEKMRRERNRIHAKKTRLRKKKMIQEMETVNFFIILLLLFIILILILLLDHIKVRKRYFNPKKRKRNKRALP